MRDFFFKDWAWKWFSLALAIAIWFTVHRIVVESGSPKNPGNVSSFTFSNSLPVTLVSTAGDVSHYRLLQPTVSVAVSGPQDIIGRLQANPIHAIVVLTNTDSIGTEKQRVQVSVPPGVTLNSIEPETIGVLPPP